MAKRQENKLTVGGLYSGVGGIEFGFKNAGFCISWSTDHDKNAKKTFELNADGDKDKFIGPIGIEDLLEDESRRAMLTEVDVLTAGFPCQPFSLAGYRSGIFECPICRKSSVSRIQEYELSEEFWVCSDDECEFETTDDFKKAYSRGNAFFRVMQAVDLVRPRAIFLENVRNFETHDKGRTLETVKKEFSKRGYSFRSDVLNAARYTDIPQNRERIFMVGFRGESQWNDLPEDRDSNDKKYATDNYISNLPGPVEGTRPFEDFVDVEMTTPKGENSRYFYDNSFMKGNKGFNEDLFGTVSEKKIFYQWRRIYVRPNKNNLCPALTANMGTGGHNVPLIYTGKGIRKLTPKECFSLQGMSDLKLPEDISHAQLYKQAGNSVSVPLVSKLARAVKKALTSKNIS